MPKAASVTFGQRLRELRTAAGLTQDDLASLVDLSQPHVARYESGGREPSFSLVCRLADALGVEIGVFR